MAKVLTSLYIYSVVRRSIYNERSSSLDFYSKSGSKTVKNKPLKAVKITFFRRFLAYC
jgi:hypothetical protein